MTEQLFNLSQYTLAKTDQVQEDLVNLWPLPIRNPGKLDFVRINSDPAYQARVYTLYDSRAETTYIVSPALKNDLEGEIAQAELAVAANQDGETFLWLAKLPAFEGEPFGVTRMAALAQARTTWIRLRARIDRKGYDIILAVDKFQEPNWPKESFNDICRDSFVCRVINSLDHPVVRRLRGESA